MSNIPEHWFKELWNEFLAKDWRRMGQVPKGEYSHIGVNAPTKGSHYDALVYDDLVSGSIQTTHDWYMFIYGLSEEFEQ